MAKSDLPEAIKDRSIVVVAGGRSQERDISLRSGRRCFESLQKIGYRAKFLDLQKLTQLIEFIECNGSAQICFLCTHGTYGEDGRLQGVLDWLGLPYTGSRALASSLAMNKHIARRVMQSHGLPVAKGGLLSELLNINGERPGLPLFIKPIASGSSYGAKIIESEEDWASTCMQLSHEPSDWLVEEFVQGREITISLIQINGELTQLPVLELRSKNKFYDLDAKYTPGQTEFILPAKLKPETSELVETLAKRAFRSLGCSGFARIDMILSETDDAPIILEINTLPGMTETSDMPAQAAATGISYDELVELMLLTAR